ncbi:MAG: hypothetical protein N2167_07150 [Flavobacteriales bacterium]|nr:hypothetical protein [Flavobacteriales bacterium]
MSTTMLEYAKTILEKVSFDVKLFKKEFEKAVKMLMPDEVNELIQWIKSNFAGQPVLEAIEIDK